MDVLESDSYLAGHTLASLRLLVAIFDRLYHPFRTKIRLFALLSVTSHVVGWWLKDLADSRPSLTR